MSLIIEFLPDRLNREPVVFRGMSATELMLAFSVGFISGLFGGVLPAISLGIWALIPTGALVGAALFVLAGGRLLTRLKRGRHDAWLYQAISALLARHGAGDARLIQYSAVWTVRRSQQS